MVSVRDGHVSVQNKAGETTEIAFGACVWATGIAMNPLVRELQQAFPESQTHFRSLLTDEYLRVKGSDGSIWAFGDAATIDQPRALQRADELFELADVNKVGQGGGWEFELWLGVRTLLLCSQARAAGAACLLATQCPAFCAHPGLATGHRIQQRLLSTPQGILQGRLRLC